MISVQNIFEPHRLFLVWHHLMPDAVRHRRVVGELIRDGEDASFRYLKDTADFEAAIDEGFIGFPAFDLKKDKLQSNALDAFLRRLPPRKREDYKEYLAQYNLPTEFSGSTFALLGYTGARLASDAFELCPDLSDAVAPLDIVIELSGVQHHLNEDTDVVEGAAIEFKADSENPFDPNAVQALANGKIVGYVNKALSPSFKEMMSRGTVSGVILKRFKFKSKPGIIVLVRYV